VITQAPLPEWSGLLRSLLRRRPSDLELTAAWSGEREISGVLSRSSWSFALIAEWRRRQASAAPVRVWLPDYICNWSLAPLRATGAQLAFYPISAAMTPDLAVCREMALVAPPDIFVLVHYFGKPAESAPVRDFCARQGAWLVEDAAHVLRPVPGVGTSGDFVLYSPHKHLAIPDGAVLVVRGEGPSRIPVYDDEFIASAETWPSQLKEVARRSGVGGLATHARTLGWLTKRLLQRLGFRRRPASMVEFRESPTSAPDDFASLGAPYASALGRRLLAESIRGLGRVTGERQRHQLVWDALLLDEASTLADGLRASVRPSALEWTPYLAAYQGTEASAESAFHQWRERGLHVTSWPDLPPEVKADQERHRHAWHLRHQAVYLPLHQSLSVRAIAKAAHGRSTEAPSSAPVSLEWDAATREEWNAWLIHAGQSSLQQSWAYGDAKVLEGGWHLRRGVFRRGSQPIAIVQALSKRVALGTLTRINRGPLMLTSISVAERDAIWRELARLGRWSRGRVLSVAPELELSGSSLLLMEAAGFRQFSRARWRSMWVDLEPDLESIRKRLSGKWRNMLSFAERSGMQAEVGCGEEHFAWMLERYEQLMDEKGFQGPPVGFLKALWEQSMNEKSLMIIRARHEDEIVAGICVARHGASATYLLGWNGAAGRAMKANQFLLWNAVTQLKALGMSWFDLGGLDEEGTPGISAFKAGMNGTRYESAGEYWRW
jgi:hypothetical protein